MFGFLDFWFLDCWIFGSLDFWIIGCLDLCFLCVLLEPGYYFQRGVSNNQRIQKPKSPNIQKTKHPNSQTSQNPKIPKSKNPNICKLTWSVSRRARSTYPKVWLFGCLDFWVLFLFLDVWTFGFIYVQMYICI